VPGQRQSKVARKHENPPSPLPACQRHVGHAAYMLAVPGNGGQVIKGSLKYPPLEKGPPCPPWRDNFSIDVRPHHPGLGQGRDRSRRMPCREKPGLPWRDRRWRMPQSEKPGLGQGLGPGGI